MLTFVVIGTQFSSVGDMDRDSVMLGSVERGVIEEVPVHGGEACGLSVFNCDEAVKIVASDQFPDRTTGLFSGAIEGVPAADRLTLLGMLQLVLMDERMKAAILPGSPGQDVRAILVVLPLITVLDSTVKHVLKLVAARP